MIRQTLCVLALITSAGCTATNNSTGSNNPPPNSNNVASGEPTPEELAAYAGGQQYPSTQPAKSDLPAAAIISGDRGTLRIYNFSKEPIREGKVWVNGAFVGRFNGVAPQSSTVIRTRDLYNSFGQNLASTSSTPNRVQIQSDGELYNVLGPATE